MVNLFEPFLISLLKKFPISSAPSKFEGNMAKEIGNLQPKVLSKINFPAMTPIRTDVPIKHAEMKDAFFSEVKTDRWMEILRDSRSVSEELKPHWSFLFPEIPWSEDRIYWEDEKSKSKFYGTIANKKGAFSLCLLFESLRTGKIWIYLEYFPTLEKSCAVIFRTEKEFMKRKIQRDKSFLASELKILGKIRISVETSNDNLVKLTQNQLGILV